MAAKVADASVLAALAFGEPRAGEAAQLLANAELYAPDLLPYELASVALKKIRASPSLKTRISFALTWVLGLDIRFIPIPAHDALAVAQATQLTIYDAAYLHLARRLSCALVTFDERLARQST